MRILVAHTLAPDHPTSEWLQKTHAVLARDGHTVDYLLREDVPARWRGTPFSRIAFSWSIYQSARLAHSKAVPYDIVIVDWLPSLAVVALRRRFRARIIAVPGEHSLPLARRADHVLCLNQEQRRIELLHSTLPDDAITCAVPAADDAFEVAGHNRDYNRCRRLLLSGIFNDPTDFPKWAETLAQIAQQFPDLELHVLENQPIPKPELFSRIPSSLHSRIRLLNPSSTAENAAIMADSDLFFFRGLWNRALQSLAAAMRSGLPIVAEGPGFHGVVENEVTGLITSTKSPVGILRALAALVSSHGLREKLGINARREATAKFTWNNAAAKLERTYDQVLRLTPASPNDALRMLFAIHVSRDSDTAVYKNTRERVAYLENQGCRCTILAPDDFPWTQALGARFTPLLYPIALALWLLRRACNIDVATFHSYAGWATLGLSQVFRRLKNLRTVVQFHGLEPLYFSRLEAEAKREQRPLSWRYRFVHGHLMLALLRRSCRQADMVLCLNSEEFRFLVDHKWAERDHLHLVANPAPDVFFLPREHRHRATRLLFVGQWLNMKGTSTLVETFGRLHREFPHLRLLCAGTLLDSESVLQHFPPEIHEYVAVFPRVSKSELLDLHRRSDVFVFPTLSEGFSLALIEAMASGLPIVTTPTGAAPDILRDGESVVFCPTNQADALVEALSELVDDRTRREYLGRNAQRAAEAYRTDSVWRNYAICLNQLAGHAPDNRGTDFVASAAEDE